MQHAHDLWRFAGLGRACLLTCVVALALAACAPAQPPLPTPYFSASDVSMDSPSDGWAVGNWVTPGNTPDATRGMPMLAHYQHGQWRLAPTSVTGNYIYQLVRMLSPVDGWATGFTLSPLTGQEILHYDGVRWRLVFALPGAVARSITIADLEMFSPQVGWAVGEDGILQFAHGVWTNITASLPPPPADWLVGSWTYPGLRAVAIASPTEAWAMGEGGVIWRYDGAGWRIVASPYFPNSYYTSPSVDGFVASDGILAHAALTSHNDEALYASQMLSPTEGWSVGGSTLPPYSMDWGPAVVEQYQAGAWQVVHIATRIHGTQPAYQVPLFYTLAMTSAQEGWIGGAWVHPSPEVGNGDTPPPPGQPVYAPLLLHYHAGQWTYVAAPAVGAIHRVVMVSPSEGWAAADGGLLHYSGGQWRLVSVSPAAT